MTSFDVTTCDTDSACQILAMKLSLPTGTWTAIDHKVRVVAMSVSLNV